MFKTSVLRQTIKDKHLLDILTLNFFFFKFKFLQFSLIDVLLKWLCSTIFLKFILQKISKIHESMMVTEWNEIIDTYFDILSILWSNWMWIFMFLDHYSAFNTTVVIWQNCLSAAVIEPTTLCSYSRTHILGRHIFVELLILLVLSSIKITKKKQLSLKKKAWRCRVLYSSAKGHLENAIVSHAND